MAVNRRELMVAAPLASLGAVLAAGSARGALTRPDAATDLYRVDDPATIMAAAKAIIEADYIGVLVTIDADGMPRARPVGVGPPRDDWSLWVSTRRGSRKTIQVAANPKAALHFGFDDTANGHKDSFYASFTGFASVHTDADSIAKFGPSERFRGNWPDYPNDLALIRLKPVRLEVMGKGIMPSEDVWQPQGVLLPGAGQT